MQDRIVHHEDTQHGAEPIRHFLAHVMLRSGRGVPVNEVSDRSVRARVDDGRWIADCPACTGALVVSEIDPVFVCTECASPENGGRYYQVEFPPNKKAVEMLLLARPANAGRQPTLGIGGSRFYCDFDLPRYNIKAQDTRDLERENREVFGL